MNKLTYVIKCHMVISAARQVTESLISSLCFDVFCMMLQTFD